MLGMALVFRVHVTITYAHCVYALHEHCIRTLYTRIACAFACARACARAHYTLHMHCMTLALKVAFVLVLWRTVEQSDSPKERLTKATTANAAQEEN